MTGAILDTMAVLRMTFAPDLLSVAAKERIIDDDEPLFYSIVSLWEIGIKMAKGGFDDLVLPDDWDIRIVDGFGEQEIACVDISSAHCKWIESLPFHHKDPFDRMIIAQALIEELEVVSSDEKFEKYGVKRVW